MDRESRRLMDQESRRFALKVQGRCDNTGELVVVAEVSGCLLVEAVFRIEAYAVGFRTDSLSFQVYRRSFWTFLSRVQFVQPSALCDVGIRSSQTRPNQPSSTNPATPHSCVSLAHPDAISLSPKHGPSSVFVARMSRVCRSGGKACRRAADVSIALQRK